MSKVRCVLVFALCPLALPQLLWAQEGISLAGCNKLLGADYEALPTTARQARLVQFDSCWRRLADIRINRNYSNIVRDVNAYKTSARKIVIGAIAGKADTAVQLMRAEQSAEQAAVKQSYEEALRAIHLRITPENRTELQAQGRELLSQTRVKTAELLARHQKDYFELQDKIKDSYTMADDQIDRIVDADLVSLGQQHEDKLSYVGDMFDRFLNAAPDQSIQEYDATKPIGTVAEVEGTARIVHGSEARDAAVGAPIYLGDTLVTDARSEAFLKFKNGTTLQAGENASLLIDKSFASNESKTPDSLLEGMFKYVSGLVGEKANPEVSISTPFGDIGIRG